jgi:hypothetical protein
MQKISFGVALVVSLLVLGCQENTTNPVSGNTPAPSALTRPNGDYSGTLKLAQVVTVQKENGTEGAADYYSIDGTIQYDVASTPGDMIQLDLNTQASVGSLVNGNTGSISASTTEYLFLADDGAVNYEKTYIVENIDRALELHVVLKVTRDNAVIDNVWLRDVGDLGRARR